MAKNEEQVRVLLKYGLAFTKLLEENQAKKVANDKAGIQDVKLSSSLGGLSSETGLRKATLSVIFAGKSNLEALTINLILKGLGKSFTQFSNYYDNLTDGDLEKFKTEIQKNKSKYKKKKKKGKK